MKEITTTTKKLARLTGVFYLFIIAGGLYGSLLVRGAIVDAQAPMATLNNLLSMEFTYRLGFLSDLLMVLSDAMVSVLFYVLLKRVNHTVALFAMVFRLVQTAVLAANLTNLYAPLLIIGQLTDVNPEAAQAVALALQAFDYGYLISGVFFANNCLLMGYLIYHSQLIPRFIGVMIGLAAVGYLSNCLAYFILPGFIEASQLIMFVTAVLAELTLCIYLLVKGTRTAEPVQL